MNNATQTTPITFYSSVRGDKDYRFGVDTTLATGTPCTTLGISAITSSGSPSQDTLMDWWKTDTTFNIGSEHRWYSLINPTIDIHSFSPCQTTPLPTDPLINNKPYWRQPNGIAGVVLGGSPYPIITGLTWLVRFNTLVDGEYLYTLLSNTGGTELSAQIQSSCLVTESGGTSVPLIAGVWYVVEFVYVLGTTSIAVTPMTTAPTADIMDFHGGGSVTPTQLNQAWIGNFGGPNANFDLVELLYFSGDENVVLDSGRRQTTLDYFWNHYFPKYDLPLVFPTCSQPIPNS